MSCGALVVVLEGRVVEVHLYGSLRRFASDQDPRRESIVRMPVSDTDTIASVVGRIGVPQQELSANVFLNGEYSTLSRRVKAADRLALFPQDMGLLYSWHFDRVAGPHPTCTIELRLYAGLEHYAQETESGSAVPCTLPKGAVAADLLHRLAIPAEAVQLVFVNGVSQQLDCPMQDGDRVALFPPVGGG